MATIDQYKIALSVTGEQAVDRLKTSISGLGAAIAGVGTLAFAQSVATLADDMNDLAEAAGLSMAAVTGFSLAVQQAGGTFEGAGKGIIKFYKALGEAGEDQSSKAAEALRKVGIGLDDIRTKSEGQLLAQAVQALAEMDAGAQRTTAVLELFGKTMGGLDPKALLEVLKTTDAEGLAEGLLKVKDANDKMSAAMFRFKVAAADALGPLMPLFDGILSVIGVVAKHLDVLGIAMGAVFGAAMLANIGAVTTAMRAFAASNPFTLIAVAVGTLVVTIAELIDEYGSLGNAMKAVGNMAINGINTMINAYRAFGQFMTQLMTGVGKAILAGLNPFSNKSAMAELQSGFEKGVGAFKKQMDASGPIKFKFDVQPVTKKKGGKSALEELLGDQGVVNKDATGFTEKQMENRQKEALAAQQVTQQMLLQNQEANKLRQLSIDVLGIDSDRANLIKSTAQVESDGRKQIADLEAKINAERAKGRDSNQEVINQLQIQKGIVQGQVTEATRLNELEYQRLQQIRLQQVELKNELARTDLIVAVAQSAREKEIRDKMLLGQMSKEEYDQRMSLHDAETKHLSDVAKIDQQIRDERAKGDNASITKIKEYEGEIYNLNVAWIKTKATLEANFMTLEAINNSMAAGAKAAMENIAKQFEPYKMAQDAVALGWRKVSDALTTFIDTGKFSFKDFARSILADLTKMIAQAMVFKYIFNPIMGALGLPVAGARAMGGSVSGNKPYIVGEKGPELFVPKSAGDIIPNNKMAATAQATGTGMVNAPVTNNYITNNINALDAKSVAQLFAENRKTLLGTVQMAQREMPYAV